MLSAVTMSTQIKNLKEYRCVCGKLLFKGTLLFSVIEVKCKRCGMLKIFGEKEVDKLTSFILLINEKGMVENVCHAAEALGLEREYCIGKAVTEVYPMLRDNPFTTRLPKLREKIFEIPNNTLVLRDKTTLKVRSVIAPRRGGPGTTDGYFILSVQF